MPFLLLPTGQVCPCSLAPGIDPAEALAATLAGLPEGTRPLPIDAPPPELADLPPECWAWDEAAGALVLGEDLSAAWARVRQQRDELLAASDWRMARARDRASAVNGLYVGPPADMEAFADLLRYRQALRDLPSAGGDPRAITWPTPPWKE